MAIQTGPKTGEIHHAYLEIGPCQAFDKMGAQAIDYKIFRGNCQAYSDFRCTEEIFVLNAGKWLQPPGQKKVLIDVGS
ncbi:Protein of unknown function [Pyronema omphalodes CBS 100304]|uniref:Uncharacterized protein n=1 Tax=Pyronema omphalodes (strain CBS 100304) TaxID=1076935 RepID=U4LDY3_PYROM|nr:Protein of unknown function [Pyronema omphalodes CBS 100304]